MKFTPETAAVFGIRSRVIRERDGRRTTAYDAADVLDALTASGVRRAIIEYVDGSAWMRKELPPGAVTPPEPMTRNKIIKTGEPIPGNDIRPVLTDVTPIKLRK